MLASLGLLLAAACGGAEDAPAPSASAALASAAPSSAGAEEEALPPLLLDTREQVLPAEIDPIAATVEALPQKYSCATLTARGRKLGKLPRRTADAYAQCQAALDASSKDLGACLRLSELFASAPRDEVLRDNVAARVCARGEKRGCRHLAEARLGSGARFDPICAEQLFETLCGEGDHRSCFRLGTLELEGELVARDATAGRSLIQRACENGDYLACLDVAKREKKNDDDARRIVEGAFDAATKACARDDAEACLELASAYAHAGQWYYLAKPAEDEVKQREMRQRACNLGSHDACNRLERQERSDPYKDDCSEVLEACTTGGEPKDDVARYADWSFRRCAAGWDGGCDAVMTLRRRKVSTTPARAKEQGTWLEAGCLEGAAGACGILALGKVVPLEPSEKVLQSGCSLGVAQSCEKLAQAAEARGDSVAQLQFLEQACPPVTSQGSESISSSACRAAGVMYKDGVGASRDLARAALLLQKGCVARRYVLDGKACEVLGTMFEGGVGVQKSLARAVDLYAAGCAREKYESTLQSLAESKAKRFGGKDAPLSPSPPQESTACARLRQWTKPKSESGG